MIVSWNWLKDYVSLDMQPSELEHRLAMSGLNHESTQPVGDDLAIDLEVTSNRPDCLGHIGVAREIAVLWNNKLKLAEPSPAESSTPITELAQLRVDCPQLCPRYTARVIQDVRVGPSPDWLAARLRSLGIAVINNIVDISNYVLMECGQPLHAFDFAKLKNHQIIVREADRGEPFQAIDHRTYTLESGMCVIADAQRSIALGGVMGGAETEVAEDTTDLLIESAQFAPLSIRNTARKLNLHSPSSYRFERGVDPVGVDWASRRCCQLILELAGGQLAQGSLDIGQDVKPRSPVVLRLSQLPRILGISIPADEVRRILTDLGCQEASHDKDSVHVTPPSWRRDLTREIDLVEEVARVHGYDQIPEDVAVPMAASHRSDRDRVLEKVRRVLTAAGYDEAMTCSLVPAEWSRAFNPWTDAEPITSDIPMKGVLDKTWQGHQANQLRGSIVPSLLEGRRYNESLANPRIQLFETAKLYLAQSDGLPREPYMLAIATGADFYHLKGIIECLVQTLNPKLELEIAATEQPLLDSVKSCELRLDGKRLGFLGEVAVEGLKKFNLRSEATVAELELGLLQDIANLNPQHVPQSPYPSTSRDFNFVVDETTRWSDILATVRSSGGETIEQIEFREPFRDPKDGPVKKRILLTVTLRAADRTLTSEEAEKISDAIVTSCGQRLGAKLLG